MSPFINLWFTSFEKHTVELSSPSPPPLFFSTKNGRFTLFVGRWVGIGVYTI